MYEVDERNSGGRDLHVAATVGGNQLKGYLVGIDPVEDQGATTLLDLLLFLWNRKFLIAAATLVGSSLAITTTFFLEERYEAEVIVIPVDRQFAGGGGLGSLADRFAGLSALGGLSINTRSERIEALAVLKSRLLTRSFIEERDLLRVLFDDLWDESREAWGEDVLEPPSLNDAVSLFTQQVRRVSEDPTTGLITISIIWKDPELAAAWANELVAEVNESIRTRRIEEARATIEFVQQELQGLDSIELRRGAYELMRSRLETIVAAKVQPDYAFRVIDPAIVPEEDDPVYPSRFIALVLGAVFGGGAGVALAGLLHMGRRRQERKRLANPDPQAA